MMSLLVLGLWYHFMIRDYLLLMSGEMVGKCA